MLIRKTTYAETPPLHPVAYLLHQQDYFHCLYKVKLRNWLHLLCIKPVWFLNDTLFTNSLNTPIINDDCKKQSNITSLSRHWCVYHLAGLNSVWHRTGHFIPLSLLDQILSADFFHKFPNSFGGENWDQSGYLDTLPLGYFKDEHFSCFPDPMPDRVKIYLHCITQFYA